MEKQISLIQFNELRYIKIFLKRIFIQTLDDFILLNKSINYNIKIFLIIRHYQSRKIEKEKENGFS